MAYEWAILVGVIAALLIRRQKLRRSHEASRLRMEPSSVPVDWGTVGMIPRQNSTIRVPKHVATYRAHVDAPTKFGRLQLEAGPARSTRPRRFWRVLRQVRGLISIFAALLAGGVSLALYVNIESCNVVGNVYERKTTSGVTAADGEVWDGIEIGGTDRRGRPFLAIVFILQEDRWRYKETKELERGPVDPALLAYVQQLPRLDEVEELIAVGTASQEGQLSTEEWRAERRADEITRVLRLLPGARNIYRLNLGQYQRVGDSGGDTSHQRKAVVIGIRERHPDLQLEEIESALRGALNDSGFDDYLRYSLFSLDRL